MSLVSRSLAVGVAGLALVGLSACSGGPGKSGEETSTSTPTSAAQSSGLANLDPCTFLTSEELSAAGVSGPSRPVNDLKSQPGCDWEGKDVLLTFSKNETEDFEKYSKNNFETFDRFDINGRQAARAVTAGSGGQGICSAIISAGGGIVDVNVAGIMRNSVADPCGEAEKIARQIEPRLPE
ncbi:DUF3558 domain-containing protein [Saccharopolyspora elongata]|uniref:DUF3558 domain-containing protein n=1 Tax=Saccharopolyspora elongata TaxID=2530387 RepID=A0A4R4Z6G2_9PSEU|nr:DUF3558 domain-containing protein [Saccharopolyspora elongata]TDD53695.1 DUF3558 domain-containing protein [Saccharopolyspora elongata]